jgi:hypothetical protein
MSFRRDEHDDFREFERQFDRHAFGELHDFEDEFDPDVLDRLDDEGYQPIRRSRAVRWTAILIVASFALGGLSSLFRFL